MIDVPQRRDQPHFQLDILTTTGGVITMLLTVDEAIDMVEEAFVKSAGLRAYADNKIPTTDQLRDDKSMLRAAVVFCFGERLGSTPALTGDDEEGASWTIRREAVVAIRVADPDLAPPPPPTPRQIGFGTKRDQAR